MTNLLKDIIRDCVPSLTLAICLRLLSSAFLVYYEHVFVYCVAFVLRISFLMSLLSILNRLDLPFSIISFRQVLIDLLGCVKVNRITSNYFERLW